MKNTFISSFSAYTRSCSDQLQHFYSTRSLVLNQNHSVIIHSIRTKRNDLYISTSMLTYIELEGRKKGRMRKESEEERKRLLSQVLRNVFQEARHSKLLIRMPYLFSLNQNKCAVSFYFGIPSNVWQLIS